MGIPFNELLVPAVLLDNPGITREEFIRLLGTLKPAMPTIYTAPTLYNLAEVLHLSNTAAFTAFRNSQKDPVVGYLREDFNPRCSHQDYSINHCVFTTSHTFEPEDVFEEEFLEIPEIGIHCSSYDTTLITEVLSAERYANDDFYPEGYCHSVRFKGQRVLFDIKHRTFPTLEALIEAYPQYHPDAVYDWMQPFGSLHPGYPVVDKTEFRWLQQDGKYSLDVPWLCNHTPPQRQWPRWMEWSYTDLLLTAEAIRTETWHALDYLHDGIPMTLHLKDRNYSEPAFDSILKNPQSRKRYETAVWDSHTSLYAAARQYTITELLLLRMLGTAAELDSGGRLVIPEGKI